MIQTSLVGWPLPIGVRRIVMTSVFRTDVPFGSRTGARTVTSFVAMPPRCCSSDTAWMVKRVTVPSVRGSNTTVATRSSAVRSSRRDALKN